MKNILITRTDRIGDVILSTPVFRAVRETYPDSHITVIVRPYAKDTVEGNPYIDEVMLYDKYGVHKSIAGSLKFCVNLMKRRFDAAIILHPTNRMHLLTWLACIPKRVGFDKKMGFLLTKKVAHQKQQGNKHELDYTLDLAKAAGIKPSSRNIFFPIKKDTELKIKGLLREAGVLEDDLLIVMHPAASCPSKRWPIEAFARVADELIIKHGARIILISSSDSRSFVKNMIQNMHYEAIDFSGRTSVGESAALIKQCDLLISNDSGPVHMAVSVCTPVIAIFGRKDNGLGPRRWGPVGKNDIILHKRTDCRKCLAHNCKNKFLCLRAISAEDVMEAAGKILNKSVLIKR